MLYLLLFIISTCNVSISQHPEVILPYSPIFLIYVIWLLKEYFSVLTDVSFNHRAVKLVEWQTVKPIVKKRKKHFFIGGTLGKWPHIRERLFRRKRKMRWLEQRAHLEVIPRNPTNEPCNLVYSDSTQQDLFISCIINHCKSVLNREETSRDLRLRTRTLFQCSVVSSQYFVTLPETDDRVASSAPG